MTSVIETQLLEFREAALAKGDGVGGKVDARLYHRMAGAYHRLLAFGPTLRSGGTLREHAVGTYVGAGAGLRACS
jgi:hypothetical protein